MRCFRLRVAAADVRAGEEVDHGAAQAHTAALLADCLPVAVLYAKACGERAHRDAEANVVHLPVQAGVWWGVKENVVLRLFFSVLA